MLDAHSNVSLALLNRVIEIKPWNYIEKAIHQIPVDREPMLFYPDEGAMKRYSDGLNLPFAFGVKRRDWETGAIEGLDLMGKVDMIAGRDVLIIRRVVLSIIPPKLSKKLARQTYIFI